MKRFFIALLMVGVVVAQDATRTILRPFDDLNQLLSNIPAKSDYIAVIAGVATNRASDGYLLWYDPTSTATTNDVVFQPYNTTGRWFKIGAPTGAGANVILTLEFPDGFTVSGSPVTNSGTITVATTITNAVIKGNGTGFTNAIPTVDYVPSGLISTSGITMDTASLLGRAIGSGGIEQFGVGTGLLLSAGVLSGTFYVDAQMFTNAGTFTWTNPPNAIASYVYCVGGGEGGWAGSPIDTNNIGSLGTNGSSGRGGNGGGVSEGWFLSSSLDASIQVVIGSGGSGGIGTNDYATNTIGAQSGGVSFLGYYPFGAWLVAFGGGSNQTCVIGCTNGSGYGGTRGGFGGASGNEDGPSLPGFGYGTNNATGGGGAGGLLEHQGGLAQANWVYRSQSTLGAYPEAPGTNGLSLGPWGVGYGGSGGGGSLLTNGFAGGNGGYPGGGGGGGGNCATNRTSGSGGNGGDGFVGIITIGFR